MNKEQSEKKRLVPDIITPNGITYVRIAMIPLFVLFFYLNSVPYNGIISAAIFALAALTDAADGYIARKYKLVSNMGKFLDPIADKVLVSTAMILLLTVPEIFYPAGGSVGYVIGAICICVIMARELIISGFRQVAATTGLVLAAEKLGKYKTAFQDISVVLLLIAIDVLELGAGGEAVAYIGLALFLVATVLTVVSGVSYIVKNKEVLKDNPKREN